MTQQLEVDEGGQAQLTRQVLYVNNSYLARQTLQVEFLQMPRYGMLRQGTNRLLVGAQLTMTEIYDTPVVYVHDGTDTTSDMFRIACTFGEKRSNDVEVDIAVRPINDELPRLLVPERSKDECVVQCYHGNSDISPSVDRR